MCCSAQARRSHLKLVKTLANLGYGSRREVARMFREGRVSNAGGDVLYADDEIAHDAVRVDGEPLDPPQGLVIALNKPTGYTCSMRDSGRLVHDLLPERFRQRNPQLSSVGRLDRDTSGLLLFTDDGQLQHRIISPRSQVTKTYEATLANDLDPGAVALFASGSLQLEADDTALAPARLEPIDQRRARLTLSEGRYHQVRRMFAAIGNHVVALDRIAVGSLAANDIAIGTWRKLDESDIAKVFTPWPTDA